MQVCTSLQTDNHASTPPLSFFTGRMPFLPPNNQQPPIPQLQINSLICSHPQKSILIHSCRSLRIPKLTHRQNSIINGMHMPHVAARTMKCNNRQHMHTFNSPFLGLPKWAGTRKVKPIWFYWSKRQWVAVATSGPYVSAPCSRQITTPAPHHSPVFVQAVCSSSHPTNIIKALKANNNRTELPKQQWPICFELDHTYGILAKKWQIRNQ